MRVFGFRGYGHIDKSKRTKWDARAHACLFLGYAAGSKKAYLAWDLDDERLVVARSVDLDERPLDGYHIVVHVNDYIGDYG